MEKSDVVELLKTGTTPEQNKVKGAMRETIQDGLKYLSDADLEAIADYLFAQPPIVHYVTPNHQRCTSIARHGDGVMLRKRAARTSARPRFGAVILAWISIKL
jgi:hypothetical protein